MIQYIAIGVGGMIGALGRYIISIMLIGWEGFPYATLVVNLLGCFFLSFLLNHYSIKKKLSPKIHVALTTGIIGSFTTYSTFAIETIELWQINSYLAISYILISVLGGLLSSYIGFNIASKGQVHL